MNHHPILKSFLRAALLMSCLGATAASRPVAAQDDDIFLTPEPIQRAAPDSRRQLTIDKYNKAGENYVAGRFQAAYQAANELASAGKLDYLLRDVYYLRALSAYGGMKSTPLGPMYAVSAFKELRGVMKFTPTLTLMSAVAFMDNHEYLRAGYEFGQYIDANTTEEANRRYARLNRAFAYEREGTEESFVTAISFWDDIVRRGETSRTFDKSGIYYLRGAAHLRLAEYKEALADLDEAIRLDPKSTQSYHSRLTLYAQLGNDVAMKADLAKLFALGEKPDVPNVNSNYVRVNKAIYAGTATAHDYGDRALMLLLGGGSLVPQRDAEQSLKLDPKDILGLLATALLMRAGDEKTVQAFSDIIARAPDQVLAYSGRGAAYEALNKYDLAATDFEKAYIL
ncbi:MAG: tetratricopeptide repeat protein, partial [Chthonomonadales bacterium]